jgi:hypothetical protein
VPQGRGGKDRPQSPENRHWQEVPDFDREIADESAEKIKVRATKFVYARFACGSSLLCPAPDLPM